MHQEITSHQALVESVCERAQQLVEQTQDSSMDTYLHSIKQLFQDIVKKSQVGSVEVNRKLWKVTCVHVCPLYRIC